MQNIDSETVRGFGEEWTAFDQAQLSPEEHQRIFDSYFAVFPFADLPVSAEGFDLGCGSGRWAALIAPRVRLLHCIDPAEKALAVARRRLSTYGNVRFHCAGAHDMPLAENSQDFGYAIGVLHCIPDPQQALLDCVAKLKRGAPFLLYLYYRFDNRSRGFRALWWTTDRLRRVISRLPFKLKKAITDSFAALVYWPLARISRTVERFGGSVEHIPLSAYRKSSFYTMRTDALDRFGTRLERRFARTEIETMMKVAGLRDIVFHEDVPFWTACGRKS